MRIKKEKEYCAVVVTLQNLIMFLSLNAIFHTVDFREMLVHWSPITKPSTERLIIKIENLTSETKVCKLLQNPSIYLCNIENNWRRFSEFFFQEGEKIIIKINFWFLCASGRVEEWMNDRIYFHLNKSQVSFVKTFHLE